MTKEIKELIAEARENIDSIRHATVNCPKGKYVACYFGESGDFQISALEPSQHTRRDQISFGWCGCNADVEEYINDYEEDEL